MIMRRSKRLAVKKANFSETEGSSQEEVADVKGQDVEALNLRDNSSDCSLYIIDKTRDKSASQFLTLTSDHEDSKNDASDGENDDEDLEEGDEIVSTGRLAESQDNKGNLEDFIYLSTESKKTFKDSTELSSELQVDINTQDLYLSFDKKSFKPVSFNRSFSELAFNDKELMKRSVITSDFEKRHSVPPMHVSQFTQRRQKKKVREETAGPMWFNLPATQITPEIEKDMKIMKMRNILDRKRHYKKNDSSVLPKYFQIGTVVEGSTDYYASRIPKRQQKSNMIDELLSDAEFRRYNKKKYLEIQAAKQSGKKGFHKKKMNKRKSTWSRT